MGIENFNEQGLTHEMLPHTDRRLAVHPNGRHPRSAGASIAKGRERITVWASFNGGRTWPLKRLVDAGPSACSNLGVGRTGTPSQGRIYLICEGSPAGPHEDVQVVSFNLSWLLAGRNVAAFLETPR